jgi:hypothetical protein
MEASMKRVAVVALVLAGLVQIVASAMESGYNTAVGMAIGGVLLGLAALAALGRWWSLGVVALVSGLLVLAAIGQLMDRINDGATGEIMRVLAFQALLVAASVTSAIAAVRSRSPHTRGE